VVEINKERSEAQTYCEDLDAFLVTVGSDNWDFVTNLLTSGTEYWTGWHKNNDGDWTWVEFADLVPGYATSTYGVDPWRPSRPYSDLTSDHDYAYFEEYSWQYWGWNGWWGWHTTNYGWRLDNYDSSKSSGPKSIDFVCSRPACDGDLMNFYMSDTAGDGWNGAVASMVSCDGNVLQTLALATGSEDTERLCLAGDYGRFIVNVSAGTKHTEVYWELSFLEDDTHITDISGIGDTSVSSCDACEVLTINMEDGGGNGWQGTTLSIYSCGLDPKTSPQ